MPTICPFCQTTICRKCAVCNNWECEHHEFIPASRPKGCVCEAGEWRDPGNIPPVCNEYKGDGKENCCNCEHDLECHKQKEDTKPELTDAEWTRTHMP